MKRPSRLLPDGAGTAGPARAARTMSLGSERNHASAGCRWVKAGHKLARHEVLLSAWSFIPSVSPSPAHLGRAGWWLAGVSTAGILSSSLQGGFHGVTRQPPDAFRPEKPDNHPPSVQAEVLADRSRPGN